MSLNELVQSAGFPLKTQPRLLLLPITPHGLTTAAVSSWVHLILSSNLSRKFKTLLQDSFSWHPVTTTQHLSWKNCTGFPFQNVLNMKSLVCVSVLKMVLVLLISLNCYMSCTPSRTLRSSSDTRMLKIQQYKRKTHGFRTISCFGPHIWNSLPQDLRHCSTLSSFKAKLKTFLFSQSFHPNYQYPVSATVLVCVCVCVCVCVVHV